MSQGLLMPPLGAHAEARNLLQGARVAALLLWLLQQRIGARLMMGTGRAWTTDAVLMQCGSLATWAPGNIEPASV